MSITGMWTIGGVNCVSGMDNGRKGDIGILVEDGVEGNEKGGSVNDSDDVYWRLETTGGHQQ